MPHTLMAGNGIKRSMGFRPIALVYPSNESCLMELAHLPHTLETGYVHRAILAPYWANGYTVGPLTNSDQQPRSK